MRAMIVDDEPLARRELRRLLAEFAWIDIVGEAASVGEAALLIERLLPELLFLDIQMPGGTGFDLLERLEHLPRVVFTTAYDKHAVRAFEVSALDYLLKPIEPERLAAAVTRAQAAAASTLAAAATSGTILERLFLRDGDRCWFVPLREVKLFTAEGNTCGYPGTRFTRCWDARSQASNRVWIPSGSSVPTASRSSISNTSKA
jgi:two-component system LytT family response regulator